MMRRDIVVFTIGHSNRSGEELLALLGAAGIRTLIDVRAQPVSSRHPQFNTDTLRALLETSGIAYHWAGRQLGGLRAARPDSPHTALPAGGLRSYADHMETDAFQRGVTQLLKLAGQSPAVMMCAERAPEDCHRTLIADYLLLQGVTVVHLIDLAEQREHQLDARARRESLRLVYDRGVSGALALD